MMANRLFLTITLLVTGPGICSGSGAESTDPGRSAPEAGESAIRVEHDAETFVTTIHIRAEDGRVAWSEVLRGLARARGYDETALEGVLPNRRFRVSGAWPFFVRRGLDVGLGKHVGFRVERPEGPDGEPWLVITLDRTALLSSQRRLKAWLRKAILSKRRGSGPETFGLELDEDWQNALDGRNLVVLVHGIGSAPEMVMGLLAAPRDEGFPCGAFRYPDDQPIADSAKLLSEELKGLAERHPGRAISLLTHSMGGLVARAAVEDPELDPGNVRQLIMIAPPNHGSMLAEFAFGLEVWEQLADRAQRSAVRRFYAAVEDGLAEGADDLEPGSLLLRELNARGRNPNVEYTIFLGTGARLTEEELAAVRRRVAGAERRSRWVRLFGPKVDAWLADLDEVVKGKGDGVVAVKRGRLEGVDDTVVLDFGHLSVDRASGRGDAKKVHEEVLKRLKGTR